MVSHFICKVELLQKILLRLCFTVVIYIEWRIWGLRRKKMMRN